MLLNMRLDMGLINGFPWAGSKLLRTARYFLLQITYRTILQTVETSFLRKFGRIHAA